MPVTASATPACSPSSMCSSREEADACRALRRQNTECNVLGGTCTSGGIENEPSPISKVATDNTNGQVPTTGPGSNATSSLSLVRHAAPTIPTVRGGFGGILRRISKNLGFGNSRQPKGSPDPREGDHENVALSSTAALSELGSDENREGREDVRRRHASRGSGDGGHSKIDSRSGAAKVLDNLEVTTKADSTDLAIVPVAATRHASSDFSSSGGREDGKASSHSCSKGNSDERHVQMRDDNPETKRTEGRSARNTPRTLTKSDSANQRHGDPPRSKTVRDMLLGDGSPLRELGDFMGLNRRSEPVTPLTWATHQELSKLLKYFPRGHGRPFGDSYTLGKALGSGGFAEVKSGTAKMHTFHASTGTPID